MSLRVGIVGLPNVGKSTLFNALLKKRAALSANYPFATIEPNTGVIAVPDSRLSTLAAIIKAEEKMDQLPPLVPAVVEFVDIAGLVKGASTGAGLGNQFLSHIREVDAIIHVLRDFEDGNIIREGSVAPDEDKLTIETELALSDLQVLEKLISAQEKQAKIAKDLLETEKLEILKRVQNDLGGKDNSGGTKILGKFHIGDERLKSWFKTLPLLTIKPILSVYNVSEDEYSKRVTENVIPDPVGDPIDSRPHSGIFDLRGNDNGGGKDSIVICAKLEEDLVELPEAERQEYLKELEIEETGLERLIRQAYHTLGLISFLTAGKKEVRAWTIPQNTKAPQAAATIHTDFEKGFIRAQVIDYAKLIAAGSYKSARHTGLIRTEGKDYIVKDGDVIEFLVNA